MTEAITIDEQTVPEPLQTAVARSFAACATCLGGAATYFLVSVTAWPLPLYQPLARRWVLSGAQRPLELSMDYYGRSLYALLGGAVAGLLAYGYARWRLRRSRPQPTPGPAPDLAGEAAGTSSSPPPNAQPNTQADAPALWLPLLYAATALAFAIALFAYQLWGRVTFPESPPASSASPASTTHPTTNAAPAPGRAAPDPDPAPTLQP